jgi:hypothetical protein
VFDIVGGRRLIVIHLRRSPEAGVDVRATRLRREQSHELNPPGLSLSCVFFSQVRTMSSSVRCGLTANLKGARVDLLLHLLRFRFGFKIILKASHAGVEMQIGVFILFKQGSI